MTPYGAAPLLILAILGLGFITPIAASSDTIAMLTDWGTSSQTLSLGGIQGLHSQGYSIFENPAALPRDHAQHYSAFFSTLADEESGYLVTAVSYPIGNGHFGIGFAQKQSPNLDFTSLNNSDIVVSNSRFSVSESDAVIGYQHSVTDRLSIGASIHYIAQDFFITRGSGWNSDIGIQYDSAPFLISVSAKNIMAQSVMTYTNTSAYLKFPMDTVVSTRYEYSDSLWLYGQLKTAQSLKAFGLRYTPIPQISGQVGWREIEANGIHSQLSAGLALTLAMMQLNFSYQTSEVLGNSSLYGVSIDVML
jgi:hypothetical protein